MALDALGNLLLGEANNERLLQATGVETILAALRQYRATPWLQVAGCRTLSRLVSHASVDLMADVVAQAAPSRAVLPPFLGRCGGGSSAWIAYQFEWH